MPGANADPLEVGGALGESTPGPHDAWAHLDNGSSAHIDDLGVEAHLTLPHQGRAFTLATGTTDARGNLESRMTLPALAPGDYVITFTGRHASGAGLKLTNTVRVGAGGNYLVIGENRPGVW